MRLDAMVRAQHQVSWGKARGWIETGKIWFEGRPITDTSFEVLESATIELKMNSPRKPGVEKQKLSKSRVFYCDTQLIVINKPAGQSTVPFEDGESGSLEQDVREYLNQTRVGIVHRLDRDTSGLLVFARTSSAEKALASQFRSHTVMRRYFALVQGTVQSQTFRSTILDDRGDGLRGSLPEGSRLSRDLGREAITHVVCLDQFNGCSLIECRLETGRTHQIRIHLSEAGHPLLGEKAYIREYTGPRREAPRMMLHAAELGFEHPTRNAPMRWAELPPEDFMSLLSEDAQGLLGQCLRLTKSQ